VDVGAVSCDERANAGDEGLFRNDALEAECVEAGGLPPQDRNDLPERPSELEFRIGDSAPQGERIEAERLDGSPCPLEVVGVEEALRDQNQRVDRVIHSGFAGEVILPWVEAIANEVDFVEGTDRANCAVAMHLAQGYLRQEAEPNDRG